MEESPVTLVLEHSKMNETANEDKRCGSFLLLRCGDVTTSSDWRQVGGAGGQWRMVTSQGGWPRPATGRVETFYLADSQSIVRWHIIHVMNPLRESLSLSRGTQFDRYVAVFRCKRSPTFMGRGVFLSIWRCHWRASSSCPMNSTSLCLELEKSPNFFLFVEFPLISGWEAGKKFLPPSWG